MKRIIVVSALIAVCGCAELRTEQPGDLPALPKDAQVQRFATFQYAMEHDSGGRSTTWEISPALRGSVAPLETVLSRTDGWCRDYEEVIADGLKRYRLVGIACRKPGPRWLVLDVRPFVERVASR
jgi:surface antigen